jgi:putative cell wall-binding protein
MAERVPLRRQLGVLVATAGIVVGGLGLLPRASATSDVTTQRFAGADRYATAVEISKRSYTSATDAVIASGEGFADALAAGYLGGQVSGPILLAKRTELPSITATELSRLGVKTVWLIGGTAAIGDAVETQLKATYSVKRIAGVDRYDTARQVATQAGMTVGTYKNDKTAIVASGAAFPDALAGGALAYGKKLPLLLTTPTALSPAASEALTALQIKRVLLLGGEAAVSSAVQTAIAAKQITVERIGGANRFDTAARVADVAVSGLAFKNTEVVVASGNGFADALAGATYVGKNTVPVLLMGSVPAETRAFVKNHNGTISMITALGGTAVISDPDLAALTSTATCTPATTTTAGQPTLPTLLPGSTTTTTTASSTSSTLQTCTTSTTAGSTTTLPGGSTSSSSSSSTSTTAG